MPDNVSETTLTVKAAKSFKFIFAVIVFLTAFLIYAKTTNYQLTGLDDINFIHTFAYKYHPADSFVTAFETNALFGGPTPYYRPVLSLSFVISDKIAGQSESFAHFVNVLLHAFCALLVFIFLRRYIFDEKISFFAAMLFAVHPIAVYTAAWIPGRNDSLFLIGFILALAFFIEYLDKKKLRFIFLNVLFTLMCFFTKESGLIVPFIFVFYYVTHFKKYGKLDLKEYAAAVISWVIAMLVFWFARKAAMSGAGISEVNLKPDNIRMFFDYYLSAIFMTTPFRALYGDVNVSFYILGSLAFAMTAFFAFFEKNKEQRIENFFWFALPFILIAPTLVSERLWFQGNRMYVPMFAIIILFFSFLKPYLTKKNIIVHVVVAAVFIIGLVASLSGSEGFSGSLPFWNKVVSESNYDNITAKKFQANAYISNNRTDDAVKEMLTINKSINYSDPEIFYFLGVAFYQNENYKDAARVFESLLAHGYMTVPQTYANLALSYYYLKDKQKAQYYFNELVKISHSTPQYALAYVRGYAMHLQSQKGEALR